MASRVLVLSLCTFLFACSDSGTDSSEDSGTDSSEDSGEGTEEQSVEDRRYCEILLGYMSGTVIEIEVWGTQFVSDCVLESWYALDAASIQAEYGALFIEMNGPRVGLTDFSDFESTTGESRMYGDLEMKVQSSIIVDGPMENDPYTEGTVEQVSVKGYWAGSEVYQLISPNGDVYTMISMYEGGDPPQGVDDLDTLSERVSPPEGWTWQSVVLEEDLSIVAEGTLYTVQDEFKNTYQRGS
ncbi:MAG: hypothetical protein AAFV53_42115 [Myxococcota bacterium]